MGKKKVDKEINKSYLKAYVIGDGSARFLKHMKEVSDEEFAKLYLSVKEFYEPKLARKELSGELTIKTKEEILKEATEIFE